MNSKTRLLTAWSFREPDRVPIEARLYEPARGYPGADQLAELIDTVADNLKWVSGFDWGFFGLDAVYHEEIIEEVPGAYRRMRRTYDTPAGAFYAITRHEIGDLDPNDYHWERRYIHTLDDFIRLVEADRRRPRPFNQAAYNTGCREIGTRGLPATSLSHPLGTLVRQGNLEEVYGWLLTERERIHRFLGDTTTQIVASLETLRGLELADPPVFTTAALEMLIPPWLGKDQFKEFVFPYDQAVNHALHALGGRHRAHCHGRCGAFLELFADMGVDGVEPLEPEPFGDTVLADAKKRVGGRMLLSGNIPSQSFYTLTDAEVRAAVRQAIRDGAPGGGFTLRETSGASGLGKTRDQIIRHLALTRVQIETALEFGRY